MPTGWRLFGGFLPDTPAFKEYRYLPYAVKGFFDNLGKIEQHTFCLGGGCQDGVQQMPVSPTNIGDGPERGKIISGENSRRLPVRFSRHRLIK